MKTSQPIQFIIFGATGDLASRKLYPALFDLYRKELLNSRFSVIGTARRPWTNEHYREIVIKAVSPEPKDQDLAKEFADHFYYLSHNVKDTQNYAELHKLMIELDKKYETASNQLYYFSISPEFFGIVAKHLTSEKLLSANGHSRVIVEKPFGTNLENSTRLNEELKQAFTEEQIYRIDHYLGKDGVQSIINLRQNNPLFKKIWHHTFIKNIQITLAEEIGVEDRGGYFDQTGALRDMFQNHILQLISLLLADLSKVDQGQSLSNQKAKAVNNLFINPDTFKDEFIRGQYTGQASYRQENDVFSESMTETFVAGTLFSHDPNFQNIPIYFQTGKALEEKESSIDIVFKNEADDRHSSLPNILTVSLDPGKWTLLAYQSENGHHHHLPVEMASGNFEPYFGDYEQLFYEALIGEKTHFVHWKELEASWKIVDNIRKLWEKYDVPLLPYESGSRGPNAKNHITSKYDDQWIW